MVSEDKNYMSKGLMNVNHITLWSFFKLWKGKVGKHLSLWKWICLESEKISYEMFLRRIKDKKYDPQKAIKVIMAESPIEYPTIR